MRGLAILGALLLLGCGQPAAPASDKKIDVSTPSGRPVAEIAARMSTLPAPYAQGDYENGRKVFAQCRSCHTVETGGPNRVGPHLHGVFGRTAGSVADFRNYSTGLKESGIVWNAVTLDKWVSNPRDLVPVNNMIFPGIRKEEDRRDLIAYLAVEAAD